MNKLIFDSKYFGIHRVYGYNNYEKTIKDPNFLKRFDDCAKVVTGKILELGCGLGTYSKLAFDKKMNWLALDSSKFCFENREIDFILSDAFEYLNTLENKSINFIVSFDFLECNDDEYLKRLKTQMDRVSINQIHYSRKKLNEKYYNPNVRNIIDEDKIIGEY